MRACTRGGCNCGGCGGRAGLGGTLGGFDPEHDPKSAKSTPDYDSWGPDSYWSCTEWRQWHTALKAAHGRNKANQIWAAAWQQQGIGEHAINCRSFDPQFRAWAKSQGLFDALYWGPAGILAKPLGVGMDVADGVASTAQGISAYSSYIVPLVGAFLLWKLTRR